MACDANYFPFATLLARQISDAFPARDFDICILTNDDLPEHALTESLSLRLLRVEMPDSWQALDTNWKISAAAYLRLTAPRLLAAEYDRLLYLDSDILYLRGDIPRLLDADLSGRPVGAVLDNLQHRSPGRIVPEFKGLGLGYAPYFNSGVLLIDVAQYLAQEIEQKAFAFARPENWRHMPKHDQSLLNLALHKNWAELPPQWNFPCFHKYFFHRHWADPCLLHFMSSRKPWRDTEGIYDAAIVRLYRDHLRTHFPDRAAQMPPRLPMGARVWFWRAFFAIHALDFRRMARYLDRFSSDFDIQ